MVRVRRRRDIIERKVLLAHLDGLMRREGHAPKARAEALGLFKEALRSGATEIRRRFEEERAPGPEIIHANAFLIDEMVLAIHEFAVKHVHPSENPGAEPTLAIVATGGYGRAELAPYSDVDLMFLLAEQPTPHVKQAVEYMLYMLWDLGLKVGHATRTVEECVRLARDDLTIRTSLLEARLLWGDEELFRQFKTRFNDQVVLLSGPAFVEAKLAERDERLERMGDTRYLLEPHVKEGKGGLRDLQTLFWIANYLYRVESVKDLVDKGVLTPSDLRRFSTAAKFLWTVRCHLHYVTGRAEERLTFDVQTTIGRRMGYADRDNASGVERFMKHYFLVAKHVGDLTRILCAVLEDEHKKRRFRFPWLSFRKPSVDGFRVDGNRLTVDSDDAFRRDPVKLLRLFQEAQKHDLDIHPHVLRLVTQSLGLIDRKLRADPEANRVFLEMLMSPKAPDVALKRLNEAGVFGRFVPEFGRVVAQMQYDMYHVYTVDEHTIHAIGILSRIEQGAMAEIHPVASLVVKEVTSRRALYVALLLHDIAKGRGGDHSVVGAKLVERLGPRFGLTPWETETAAWLVRHHLLLSLTAFKRDIDNPKTVSNLVAIVQSPERLRMLQVLTVADIHAVGPNVWNEWKANLIRELYYRALEELQGGVPAGWRSTRVERAKAALRDALEEKGWIPAEIDAHVALGYSDYWLAFDTSIYVHHAYLIRRAEDEEEPVHLEARIDKAREVTEVIIYTADHPGLFARIAGAMALTGASIVDAKIVTLANGMALDTFSIQDARHTAFEERPKLDKLWERIRKALSGEIHAARELSAMRDRAMPSRTEVFKVAPEVIIDNQASAHHTVVEVNGRDRPCLLHDVTSTLTSLGLQIASAHIATFGERVVDVFYVKDIFGLKIEQESKLRDIRARLFKALEPGCSVGPPRA